MFIKNGEVNSKSNKNRKESVMLKKILFVVLMFVTQNCYAGYVDYYDKYFFPDGSWFEGTYKNDLPNAGILHLKNGKILTGEFRKEGNHLTQVSIYDIRKTVIDENGNKTVTEYYNDNSVKLGASNTGGENNQNRKKKWKKGRPLTNSEKMTLGGLAAAAVIGTAGTILGVGAAVAAGATVAAPEVILLILF